MGIEPTPISLSCVCNVDFCPSHAPTTKSHLPSHNNALYHVHITSPALWLCKPRSVNYSNTHIDTLKHTHIHIHEQFPEALHKATMSHAQAYGLLLSPHTSLYQGNRWTAAIVDL